MRIVSKMVIVVVMVSTLAACNSKITENEVTSSIGPTAQPTAGVTPVPSAALSPSPTPTPQPQATASPKPTASPAPSFSGAAAKLAL